MDVKVKTGYFTVVGNTIRYKDILKEMKGQYIHRFGWTFSNESLEQVEKVIEDRRSIKECFVVIGNTIRYKEVFKEMGGYYAPRIDGGPGWIFPIKNKEQIDTFLEISSLNAQKSSTKVERDVEHLKSSVDRLQKDSSETLQLLEKMNIDEIRRDLQELQKDSMKILRLLEDLHDKEVLEYTD